MSKTRWKLCSVCVSRTQLLEFKTLSKTTSITHLDEDSLAHCASFLGLQDISNLAISCKSLKKLAYSDSIWLRLFREQWPWSQDLLSSSLQTLGGRELFLARRKALLQFKFADPMVLNLYTSPKPFDNILMDKKFIHFSQGHSLQTVFVDELFDNYHTERDCPGIRVDHNARITCIRSFVLDNNSSFRSARKKDVLVTSSYDHTIRVWWKGCIHRCFRGHNGPVTTLSDKLLGDANGRLLASGGEDGTVRLWAIESSRQRGLHASKATLYGHEKPVKLMSVAGHRSSLLVSISSDSKVRVWDTSTSSAVRSSCCVGMTSVAGAPVDMKCHDSLLYVAAGSSVVTIDLRTMQKVITAAICQPKLHSFAILPSESLICTGGVGKAMLWDIRRNQETLKPEPMAELDGHTGPVAHLYMDPYKVVTGGPKDLHVKIWETDTGMPTNSLLCCPAEESKTVSGCLALAVDGCRIATLSSSEQHGLLHVKDFSRATCAITKHEDEHVSKFWGPQSDSDTDEDI